MHASLKDSDKNAVLTSTKFCLYWDIYIYIYVFISKYIYTYRCYLVASLLCFDLSSDILSFKQQTQLWLALAFIFFLLMFVISSRLMCQYIFVVVFQSGQRPGAASWLQRREVSDSSKRVPPSGERVICPSRCNFSSFYLLLWRSSHFQLCGKHTAWAVNFLCKVTFPDYVQITQHTQNTHTQDAPTDKGLR